MIPRIGSSRIKGFSYHMNEYFSYHPSAFLYSFILVLLVYSIVNYKRLINIDEKKVSKKASKWFEEPKMKE